MNPILQLYVFGIGIVVLVYGNLQALNILAEDYPNIRFIALTPDSNGEVKRLMGRLHLKWGKHNCCSRLQRRI